LINHEVLPSTGSKKPRFFYGYIIVVASFIILTIMWGAIFSFGVFLKPMAAVINFTQTLSIELA